MPGTSPAGTGSRADGLLVVAVAGLVRAGVGGAGWACALWWPPAWCCWLLCGAVAGAEGAAVRGWGIRWPGRLTSRGSGAVADGGRIRWCSGTATAQAPSCSPRGAGGGGRGRRAGAGPRGPGCGTGAAVVRKPQGATGPPARLVRADDGRTVSPPPANDARGLVRRLRRSDSRVCSSIIVRSTSPSAGALERHRCPHPSMLHVRPVPWLSAYPSTRVLPRPFRV